MEQSTHSYISQKEPQSHIPEKQISSKKHQALLRLFENSNLKSSDVLKILTPYGFFADGGTKHRRLMHINDGPRNEKDTSRSYFLPLPMHANESLSKGVIKQLRTFVYHRLPAEVQKSLGFTPLEFYKTG